MTFKIKNRKGTTIAEFLFEYDRDVCYDLINEDNNLIKYTD